MSRPDRPRAEGDRVVVVLAFVVFVAAGTAADPVVAAAAADADAAAAAPAAAKGSVPTRTWVHFSHHTEGIVATHPTTLTTTEALRNVETLATGVGREHRAPRENKNCRRWYCSNFSILLQKSSETHGSINSWPIFFFREQGLHRTQQGVGGLRRAQRCAVGWGGTERYPGKLNSSTRVDSLGHPVWPTQSG